MKIETRVFGMIEIDDDKIIHFPGGIIGFPEMTDFALVYDKDKGRSVPIRWLQSLQESEFAMPVMDPLLVKQDYNPEVDNELLDPLEIKDLEEVFVLVTISVPQDLTAMSVNLQAPLIVNAQNRKAAQVIVNPDLYPVKYYIYTILQEMKKEEEETYVGTFP